jgi:hypothetical protein
MFKQYHIIKRKIIQIWSQIIKIKGNKRTNIRYNKEK